MMLENKLKIYDRFVCFQLREAAWFYFMSKLVELLDTVSRLIFIIYKAPK